MWREHCFGTLSKFGVAVKSLSVEHCIQASEQGEEVTHLPGLEQVPLFAVNMFICPSGSDANVSAKLYLEGEPPDLLKQYGLQ